MYVQKELKMVKSPRAVTVLLPLIIAMTSLQNSCTSFIVGLSTLSSKAAAFQNIQTYQKKVSSTIINNNKNHVKPESTRMISLNMVGRSAFGKAAIGLKKRNNNDHHHNHNHTSSLTTNYFNNNILNNLHDDNEEEESAKESAETKALLHKRDRALLALQQHLKLSTQDALQLLTTHPSLYTDVPSLSLKLTYLLHELNIPKSRLQKMLQTHPTLTTKVILDSEEHLSSTLQILQEELDLNYADLKTIITKSSNLPTLLNYSRSTLKRKIRIYTSGYLSLPPSIITPMICHETRMLQINPIQATEVLEILRDALGITREDVVMMMQRDKMLLCYHPTRNTLPTISYLLHGDGEGDECSVGECLGLILRKSESTLLTPNTTEKQDIIKKRLKELLIRYPNILSTSIDTNLRPTISFLKSDVGCTNYQLGRILYRRGNILVLSLESLRNKVEYLREVLDLKEEEEDNGENENEEQEKTQMELYESHRDEYGTKLSHILATSPDLLTLSLEGNLQPKFDYLVNTFLSTSTSTPTQELTSKQKQQLQKIFSSRPQLLVLSLEKNWKPKIQYLVQNTNLTPQQIWDWWVEYPHMMSFTLEKIKERMDVVQDVWLERKRRSSGNDDLNERKRNSDKLWWDEVNDELRKGKGGSSSSALLLEPNFLGWKEKKWREWVESNQ